MYGHLPPISRTIYVRQTRHAAHCRRSKDEYICCVHLWTPTHGYTRVGRTARPEIYQLCVDTRYSVKDLTGAMDNRDGWLEIVKEFRAINSTRWWWWCEIQDNIKISLLFNLISSFLFYPIYQPLRSDRIWHKVNF